MGGRLGKRRGTGRGRRTIIWHFQCGACGTIADIPAKRRPSGDPDDVPSPSHCGVLMNNAGLFFLTVTDGHRHRVPASAIRREWDRLRDKLLRGRMCECGHWRLYHHPTPPHACMHCGCEEFREQQRRGVVELGFDPDIPF